MLQALYTIRSETLLVESLQYNLLFRWFLDLNMTDAIWDHSIFSKNQERLLRHQTADIFFARVVGLAREHGWVSDEHFPVDGTLMEAWASLKSFAPKEAKTPGRQGRSGQPQCGLPKDSGGAATHQARPMQRRASCARAGQRGQALLWGACLDGEPPRQCVQMAVTPSTQSETSAA